jgi:putative CocE/NonD family hydrolase
MDIHTSAAAITMRDGTTLRADLYRPADDRTYPVLLRRTPYRKEGWAPFARQLAAAGYVVVVQDLRGRGASDGEFIWSFADEAQEIEAMDGYDTVEWCAGYEFSNGSVGTWGHSYDGWSQLRTAVLQPKSLKAMHIAGITARYLDMTRGILDTGRRLEWCYTLGADLANRGKISTAISDEEVPVDRNAGLVDRWVNFERGKWLWFLPFSDLPDHALTGASKFFQDYIRRINHEVWNFDKVLDRVEVPTAILTGWWDRFSGAVDLYQGLMKVAPDDLAGKHRLLMGPWSHNPDTFVPDLGDLNTDGKGGLEYIDALIQWFDVHLKGAEQTKEPIHYFTVGANEWRTSDVWPPVQSQEISYFLHSAGDAGLNTGSLDLVRPVDEAPDSYSYDPRDPVMSLMLEDSHHAPKEQSPNDSRPDVLHYLTPALDTAIEVSGTPRFRLWAKTDALDTDWVIRLVDVAPDGGAINVSGGIMRARYRNSYENPELVNPNEATEYLIDLSVTSYVFLPGHRLRADITSSDFPNFDRNHNTGADFVTDGELKVAHQTILHSHEHASELLLPLVTKETGS